VNAPIKSLVIALSAFALGAVATAYLLHRPESSKNGREEAEHAETRVKRAPTGESIVVIDAETRSRMGLQIAPAAAMQLPPEVIGYGRVLDPTPLATLMAELVSAHVSADASKREFERMKTLAEQDNASIRALQAAEAAAKRDQLLIESLRTRLTPVWGKRILERDDPPAFVQSLTAGEQTLVRIDLPAGVTAQPSSARLVPLGEGQAPVGAELFESVTILDPQTQGEGYLFLVKGRRAGFSPNAAITGFLRVSGEALNGMVIPRAAVIRHDGRTWVYVQVDDTNYRRHEIALERPLETGWFAGESGGVKAGQNLVVVGAQLLLSEELKGQGGEE
jgi:hypothetical protein